MNSSQEPLLDKKWEKTDDEKIHKGRCFLEYRYIPHIVYFIYVGKIRFRELFEVEQWKRHIAYCRPDLYFEWERLSILQLPICGDCRIVIYKFPKPNRLPQAKYGAVVYDKQLGHINYYTLEYCKEDRWIISEHDTENSKSYGKANSDDLQDFIKWLNEHIQKTRKRKKKNNK